MTLSVKLKNSVVILLLAVMMTAISYFYLDTGIASIVYRLISSSNLLMRATSNIPDLLLSIVIAITVSCWAGYFFLRHRGRHNRHTRFLQACGTAVPIAFVAKDILQYLFGRPDPYAWVFDHVLPRFYWFRADAGYGCFPSGHMTVFTALLMTLWHYYPRYRSILQGLLFLLAVALIGTDYHFLSDVIAGAYLGAIIASIIDNGIFLQTPRDEQD